MYSLTLQIIVIGNMLGVILIENMLHYEILCICVRMKKLVKTISDEVEQGFLQ